MSDNGAAPRCVECGEPLAKAITPDDVITLKGHRVRFRRHTDFLLCQKSMTLYRITDIREGKIIPVTDDELVKEGEAQIAPGDDRRGAD
jgi:hypothetical protein